MEPLSRGYAALEQGEAARRAGRLDDARVAFGRAIEIFRHECDPVGEAYALTRQAQNARDTGNLDWALHDQTQAIALYRHLGDAAGLAHALRHAGDMFVQQQQLPHATTHLHEALDLYRATPDVAPRDFADTVRSIALLAEALDERAEAKRYWEQARDRYVAIDTPETVIIEVEQRIIALT